jgi:hypothetical protein
MEKTPRARKKALIVPEQPQLFPGIFFKVRPRFRK